MQLQIKAKEVEITPELEKLLFTKLGSDIDKYLKGFDDDIKQAEVMIEPGSRWGFKVSFSMMLPGKSHIYGEAQDKNLDTAVNSLKDIIQKEIRRYKSKIQDYHN